MKVRTRRGGGKKGGGRTDVACGADDEIVQALPALEITPNVEQKRRLVSHGKGEGWGGGRETGRATRGEKRTAAGSP